jgi:GntR family transcriptional regulator, vanillate catabolism transcriptional regulator
MQMLAEISTQTGRALLQLRELLLRGAFPPGERVSELPLVARLGISRTPIRMALEKLAQEGLLESSPSGGFYVRQFHLADIWDAIEMRGVLEGTAAAGSGTPGEPRGTRAHSCASRTDGCHHLTGG